MLPLGWMALPWRAPSRTVQGQAVQEEGYKGTSKCLKINTVATSFGWFVVVDSSPGHASRPLAAMQCKEPRDENVTHRIDCVG